MQRDKEKKKITIPCAIATPNPLAGIVLDGGAGTFFIKK
jgi:hypothetical protein